MLVADAAVGEAAPDFCRGAEAHAETHAASANNPKCFDLIVWGNGRAAIIPPGLALRKYPPRMVLFEGLWPARFLTRASEVFRC